MHTVRSGGAEAFSFVCFSCSARRRLFLLFCSRFVVVLFFFSCCWWPCLFFSISRACAANSKQLYYLKCRLSGRRLFNYWRPPCFIFKTSLYVDLAKPWVESGCWHWPRNIKNITDFWFVCVCVVFCCFFLHRFAWSSLKTCFPWFSMIFNDFHWFPDLASKSLISWFCVSLRVPRWTMCKSEPISKSLPNSKQDGWITG